MHQMRLRGDLLAGVLVAIALASPRAASAQYAEGDLYLLSHALPTIGYGIARIDPVTGAHATHYDIPDDPPAIDDLAYDPFRDRLLYAILGAGLPTGIQTVDSAGVHATLLPTLPRPEKMAARGDGILYLFYGNNSPFQYLDAADVVQDLLNEAGTAAHEFASGGVEAMLYHASTNSLIMITSDTLPPCVSANVCIVKMPLTPSGTQVGGAIVSTEVDISTSSEEVVGIGYGPGDTIWFVVDTNMNALEPRMQLVDPATMTVSTFANHGGFTGSAVISTGTYSNVSNVGLVFDTFHDLIRAYTLGASGNGTTFSVGLSGLGHSELARMVEIWSAAAAPTSVPTFPSAVLGALALASIALVIARARRVKGP